MIPPHRRWFEDQFAFGTAPERSVVIQMNRWATALTGQVGLGMSLHTTTVRGRLAMIFLLDSPFRLSRLIVSTEIRPVAVVGIYGN